MNLKKILGTIIIFLISFNAGEFGLIAGIENAFSNSSQLIFKRDKCEFIPLSICPPKNTIVKVPTYPYPSPTYHPNCTKDKFRCANGACINWNMLCDGYTDCDGRDDEAYAMCRGYSCSPDKFHCKSGHCIAKELLCNGYISCEDGEDEKPEVCNNPCEPDEFRCANGTCINRNMLCNGMQDCYGGDDEGPDLCKEINIFENYANGIRTTVSPTTVSPTAVSPTAVSPDVNQRTCLFGDDKKVYHHSTQVTQTCNEGYRSLTGNNNTAHVCHNGEWYPPIPKCYKTCPPMKVQNMQFKCDDQQSKANVKCSEFILEGTKVYPECENNYHWEREVHFTFIRCLPNGQWDKTLPECVTDCGQSRKRELLMLGAKPEKQIVSPWHVAIYDISNKQPVLICGGTIIGAQMIVSAATCFTKVQTNSIDDPKKYEVVVAKYTLNYTLKDYIYTKIFKIQEILVPNMMPLARTETLYAADIAILWISEKITFGRHVMPACVDWTLRSRYTAPENATGKISGWGITESGEQSPILMTKFLPFINLRNCSTMVHKDFTDSIAADKFCAGIKNKTGVVVGDGGGGLLFPKTDLQGQLRYYLRGIASNKDKTIRSDGTSHIAVFTDIAQYIDWMYEVREKIEISKVN